MPEGSTTHTTHAHRHAKGAPKEDTHIDKLRKAYEKLAQEASDASKAGDQKEFGRLRVEKQKAFDEWKKAETDEAHTKRDNTKSAGQNVGGVDPGSPLVAR